MSNYRVREKTMAFVLQNGDFTEAFKSKALMFTDVFATALVNKFIGTELHRPFTNNWGSLYLNNFNYAAVWSMKTNLSQNSPFESALNYCFSRNKNTPKILCLKWNFDYLKEAFQEFSGYDRETFEKDTLEVLNMKVNRYTVKHLSRERKIHYEPFWNLNTLGNMTLRQIDGDFRINLISFDSYLGYFFCNNVMTGNLEEISSGI